MSEVENLSYESLLEGYHRRFEAMASQLGDFPAIRFGERLISYSALNYRANQLAHALENATDALHIITWVSDETLLIPLILAIAKLGRVWVPLSFRMPALIIAQYSSKFDDAAFFTDQEAISLLSIEHPIIFLKTLSLLDKPPTISKPQILHANAQILPSLSLTSVPKALPRTSENIVRNLYTYAFTHDIRYRDQIAFAGDPGFVGNLVVIMTSLICGATIHIINLDQMDLTDFHHYLRKQSISSIHSTPSIFRLFFADVKPGDFPDLRLIRLGGEAAFKADFELFKANFARQTKFINGFGSTELGAVSFFVADHDTFVQDARLPIGKTLPFMRVEIINDKGESVVGEEGEMVFYDKLLQAYWNEVPETDGKFFSDPKNPGWMGYRSGDYGILLEDGNLIYLGRRDSQVKIRGQRVEIAAIEKRFREHSTVAEVLVKPYESKNETRLVAYLLPKAGMQMPNDNVWRAFLSQTLSEYMIPSRFIALEEFPRLPDGNYNTKALPNPVLTKIERQKPVRQPRTKPERQLLAIWQDILDFKDEISIDDSFFDLGGSSLQATALISDVNERFAVVLTPAILYQFPSIQELAALIDGEINTVMHPSIVPFRAYGRHYPIFCLPGALGNPLAFKALVHRMGREVPIYGLQMQGLDTNETLPKNLDELLNYYEEGIQSLGLKSPIYLMGLSIGGVHAFELARRLQKRHIAVEAVILLDTFFPDAEQAINYDADGEEAEILQKINTQRHERLKRKQRFDDLIYSVNNYGQRLLALPGKLLHLALLSAEMRKLLFEERNKKRLEARLLDERFRENNPVNMNKLQQEIRSSIRRTVADYRLEPYTGNVFYIKATQNSNNPNRAEAWANYVQGKFSTLEVDAPHTLLNIAHVDKVVKVLQESVLV